MQTQEEENFAAFATFLGTPLPANPIEALRILRHEAAQEIERLITFLDATGGDPDLEPTLGYIWPGHVDEAEVEEDFEPSLGWTTTHNQASRNRLGHGEDYEHDDSDKEDSDAGEDAGDFEPSFGWENGTTGRVMVDGSAIWPQQTGRSSSGLTRRSPSRPSCCSQEPLNRHHDPNEVGEKRADDQAV